jgi:transposase
VLIAERVRHVNLIKGLLFAQGIAGKQPLRRDRRERLVAYGLSPALLDN